MDCHMDPSCSISCAYSCNFCLFLHFFNNISYQLMVFSTDIQCVQLGVEKFSIFVVSVCFQIVIRVSNQNRHVSNQIRPVSNSIQIETSCFQIVFFFFESHHVNLNLFQIHYFKFNLFPKFLYTYMRVQFLLALPILLAELWCLSQHQHLASHFFSNSQLCQLSRSVAFNGLAFAAASNMFIIHVYPCYVMMVFVSQCGCEKDGYIEVDQQPFWVSICYIFFNMCIIQV